MKPVLIFLLLLLTLSCTGQEPEPVTVRVLSFNILHGATTKGDFDLDAIAKVIIDAEPDFVALQEVDYKTKRAKGYDLVTELGWRSKMSGLFGRAMPYDGGEYGEGVLSRFSLLSSRNVGLPFSAGNEPRAALEITTVLASGDTISFIGTHLDHLNEDIDRVQQANAINEAFSDNPYPTIIAGDLNAEPNSRPINILEEMWSAAYDRTNPSATYPSGQPTKKIDYVMYRPGNRWRVIERQVINDTTASDHCAYLVVLELLTE
jgi:endonuclease/exonuclease/phosphatase family metal-dependent hydrolase